MVTSDNKTNGLPKYANRSGTLFLVRVILAFVLCFDHAVAFGAHPVEAFFGSYKGEAVVDADGDISRRDLGVEIMPSKNDGFTVDWTTVSRKSDGRLKRKAYSIEFVPARRAGLYRSAMRTDMFGKSIPMDPLAGDPYVWARVRGRTLTVHALLITDAGGYEMQVYERTLTKDGMALTFSRVRDGVALRTVTGRLQRR